jgi:hypothetical protein
VDLILGLTAGAVVVVIAFLSWLTWLGRRQAKVRREDLWPPGEPGRYYMSANGWVSYAPGKGERGFHARWHRRHGDAEHCARCHKHRVGA